MNTEHLPHGYDSGNLFDSMCINVPQYLSWMQQQLLDRGAEFNRKHVQHINEVADCHSGGHADLVINCTGFESYRLGGVEDNTVYPVRGQICLVRNRAPRGLLTTSGTDDGIGEVMYVQPRFAGKHESIPSQSIELMKFNRRN